MYAMDAIGAPLRSLRQEALAPIKPVHPMVMNQRHVILYNTAIGVSELAQAHTPLEHFLGVFAKAITTKPCCRLNKQLGSKTKKKVIQ